jgi:hypothetical protein
MIALAKKHGIPFQREAIMGGGTDAWSDSLAGEGVLAGGSVSLCAIFIPLWERYTWTIWRAVSTISLNIYRTM